MAQERGPKVLHKSPIGKDINYAIDHYDRLYRYVIDGRYGIDTNLVENGQRIVALTRKNYLFCKESRCDRGCGRDIHDYGLLQTCRSQCRGMADVLP